MSRSTRCESTRDWRPGKYGDDGNQWVECDDRARSCIGRPPGKNDGKDYFAAKGHGDVKDNSYRVTETTYIFVI